MTPVDVRHMSVPTEPGWSVLPVDVRHMSVPTEPGWSVLCLFWILSDRVQFSLTMSDRDFMARAG